MVKLFAPQATTKVAATSSASGGAVLPGTRGQTGPFQIRLLNDGTTVAHIAFGTSTSVAATTSDLPIAPNSLPQGFTIANPDRASPVYFSVIMDSGTANVYVTTGDGI